MYCLLLYDVVDDYANKRQPHRDAHLALARKAQAEGKLVLAGAFHNPVDGAALVFDVSDPAEVRAFAEADPYVRNGLVTAWRVREWNVVIGGSGG